MFGHGGYGFLARQVLACKRLYMFKASVELAEHLVYTMKLLTQRDPLQVFWFREAQPMLPFFWSEARRIEAVAHPCVVLCDVDVISYRQYIHLLSVPKCIIIVVTELSPFTVSSLHRNSFRCVVECTWKSSVFFKHLDDRFVTDLVLDGSTFSLENCVARVQTKFRRRYRLLIVLQRALKNWLYRPSSRYAQKVVERCQQACVQFNK
jgi:hypothetical protein